MIKSASSADCREQFMRAWGRTTSTIAFSVVLPREGLGEEKRRNARYLIALLSQRMLLLPVSNFYQEVPYFVSDRGQWITKSDAVDPHVVAAYVADHSIAFGRQIFFFERADSLCPIFERATSVHAVKNCYGMRFPARTVARYLELNPEGAAVLATLNSFDCYFGRASTMRHVDALVASAARNDPASFALPFADGITSAEEAFAEGQRLGSRVGNINDKFATLPSRGH